MSRNILSTVALLLAISVIATLILLNQTSEIGTQPAPASPTVTPADSIVEDIAQELSKKYNKPLNSINISVDTNTGSYAKGMISYEDEMGGGLWFAAKIDDAWQLVFDGNGIITCKDLSEYPSFPTSLIPQCFDESKNMLIKR